METIAQLKRIKVKVPIFNGLSIDFYKMVLVSNKVKCIMKKLVGICAGAALLTGTGMLVQAQNPGSASLHLTGSATVNPDVGGPTPDFAAM